MKRLFVMLLGTGLIFTAGTSLRADASARKAAAQKLYEVDLDITMPQAGKGKKNNHGREHCHIQCQMKASDLSKDVPIPYILLYILYKNQHGEKRIKVHALPQAASRILHAQSQDLLRLTLTDPARPYVSPDQWKDKKYKFPIYGHRDFSMAAYHVDVWGVHGIVASKDWHTGDAPEDGWWKNIEDGL